MCSSIIHRTRIILLPNFYGRKEATTANTSELKCYVTLAIIFSAILAKISNRPYKQVATLFRTYWNFGVIYKRFSAKSHHWPSFGRLRQLCPKRNHFFIGQSQRKSHQNIDPSALMRFLTWTFDPHCLSSTRSRFGPIILSFSQLWTTKYFISRSYEQF